MKRLLLLAIAFLVLASGGACDRNGSEGDAIETQSWAAWAFDGIVVPESGQPGKLAAFAMEETYTDDSVIRRFLIEGSCLGKDTAEIQVKRTERLESDPTAVAESTVTLMVECHRIRHKVTVLEDSSGAVHPAWVEMTIWIPTGQRSVRPTLVDSPDCASFLYCKAEYNDADGRAAKWDWYLTQGMTAEQGITQGKNVWYYPVTEGDFQSYERQVLWGLYSYSEEWFAGRSLKEGTWRSGYHGTVEWICTATKKTIGDLAFSAWMLERGCAYDSNCRRQRASLAPDLPIPISLELDLGGATCEYTLTGLQLQ